MILIEENTTRAKIFDLLVGDAPLRANQIFKKINSGKKQKITFQGVHKLLKQMVKQKILHKNRKKEYAINLELLKKIKQKIAQLEKRIK